MIITTDEAKQHLNIESTFTDDDAYISGLTLVVEETVLQYLNLTTGTTGYTSSTDTPLAVKQGMLLMVGNLYLNRQMISFSQGYEIPYTFKFLLEPYRYAIIE